MGRRRAVSLDSPLPPPHPPPHSRHKRYRHCRRFLERNMVTILLLVCAYEYFLVLLWLLRVVGCCMSFSCSEVCCFLVYVSVFHFISLSLCFFLLLPLFAACC